MYEQPVVPAVALLFLFCQLSTCLEVHVLTKGISKLIVPVMSDCSISPSLLTSILTLASTSTIQSPADTSTDFKGVSPSGINGKRVRQIQDVFCCLHRRRFGVQQ